MKQWTLFAAQRQAWGRSSPGCTQPTSSGT